MAFWEDCGAPHWGQCLPSDCEVKGLSAPPPWAVSGLSAPWWICTNRLEHFSSKDGGEKALSPRLHFYTCLYRCKSHGRTTQKRSYIWNRWSSKWKLQTVNWDSIQCNLLAHRCEKLTNCGALWQGVWREDDERPTWAGNPIPELRPWEIHQWALRGPPFTPILRNSRKFNVFKTTNFHLLVKPSLGLPLWLSW